jgi:hypothetical protein
MSTTLNVTYSVHAFWRVPKDTGKDMDPTGSILLLPPSRSHTMVLLLLLTSFYQSLTTIVNEDSCDVPFINMYCDDHGVYVWEGYKLDISFGED